MSLGDYLNLDFDSPPGASDPRGRPPIRDVDPGMGWPQQAPQAPQENPFASLLKEYLRGMQASRPERPRLKWNEILAATINPRLGPFILEAKEREYQSQIGAQQHRMTQLATLLGVFRPQREHEQKPFAFGPEQGIYDPEAGKFIREPSPKAEPPVVAAPGSQLFRRGEQQPYATVPPKPEAPQRPLIVPQGSAVIPFGETKPTYVNPKPVTGPGGKNAGLTADSWNQMLEIGEVPVPPTDPRYGMLKKLADFNRMHGNPKIRGEARRMSGAAYNNALRGIMSNPMRMQGSPSTPQEQAAAAAQADEALNWYMQKFGGGEASIVDNESERLNALMEQGLTFREAHGLLYPNGPYGKAPR